MFELHTDHLGSPRYITNGNYGDPDEGHIIGEQVCGPYGESMEGTFVTPTGSISLPWGHRPVTGYTGHLNEDPTGLIYMKGRYYSPRWHRFINSDRGADPYSLNQTAYVGGSPFEATDPMGMEMKVQAQHTWYSVDMYDAEVWAAEMEAVWASIQKMAEEKARNAAADDTTQLETATAEAQAEEATEPDLDGIESVGQLLDRKGQEAYESNDNATWIALGFLNAAYNLLTPGGDRLSQINAKGWNGEEIPVSEYVTAGLMAGKDLALTAGPQLVGAKANIKSKGNYFNVHTGKIVGIDKKHGIGFRIDIGKGHYTIPHVQIWGWGKLKPIDIAFPLWPPGLFSK